MKRIALIRNSYSFDVGGAEIFPTNLAKLLLTHGYEPFILSANKKTRVIGARARVKTVSSPWWSFQNYSGFGLVLFPVYVLWLIAVAVWYMVFFKKQHIDVVHPQSRDDFIAATLAGKALRKKVVWSDHADLKHIYMNHRKWYKNPVGKLTYAVSALADTIMVESFSEKRLIESSLGKSLPSNYTVIYLGVVDTYAPKKRQGNIVRFISTSRLVNAKGIKELIGAFQLMDNPRTHLSICGDGPKATSFRLMAANTKNIEFLGHVEDVAAMLRESDVFVHPTYHEAFGLSLVEAEMCSLPIIASRVGSIPEIVQDGVSGILVEPKDTTDLAKAMERLAKDAQLRKKMGQNGRKIFLDNFQFDKIVQEKILPLYNY